MAALLLVVMWAVSGPFFGFSDTWQLVINTVTTISTGLMVFLIQNTQNRDAMAIHLKLDELIRATSTADNALILAEDETQQDLEELKLQYSTLLGEHRELKALLTKRQQENGQASADDRSLVK
jgi:low affinity Fe/Cu permease